MDEVIYEQLELFQVEIIEEDGLDFSVEIKPPKVKKKRKKRGNKHRSREVFQELGVSIIWIFIGPFVNIFLSIFTGF